MTKKQKGKEFEKFKRRHCEGKRRIDELWIAERIADKMTRAHGTPFRFYQCDICHKWHVGHEKTPFRMFMMAQNRQELRA